MHGCWSKKGLPRILPTVSICLVEIQTLAAVKSAAEILPIPGQVHLQLENTSQKHTRDGKPFLELHLLDATASLTLRIWSDHPDYTLLAALPPGSFHEMSGEFFRNGNFGIDARKFAFRPLSEEERAELLAGPAQIRIRQAADYADILRLVATLVDPRLRALAGLFLEELGSRFARSAGARFVHHARRGGLVEHTAQMMRAADALAPVYATLNRDLLLTGTLLHDCGKLWENHVPENGFDITLDERGELLGHITIGVELVNSLWRKLQPHFDSWTDLQPPTEQVRLHLLHLIVSHHGTNEFGSPVVPKTPEAIALHQIDNLDAKLEIFAMGYLQLPLVAPRIHEKVRPLNQHLITPLPAVVAPLPPDDVPPESPTPDA